MVRVVHSRLPGQPREVDGGGQPQVGDDGAEIIRRDVRNVRVAPRDGPDPLTVDVDADRRQAGPRELDGEGEADVAEPDRAGSRVRSLLGRTDPIGG